MSDNSFSFDLDLYQLAVGVLHLNLDRAAVLFPSMTRAHPSYEVVVSLSARGPLWPEHQKLFPFRVRWNVWQEVVVPLFAAGAVLVKVGAEQNETLRQWVNRAMLEDDPQGLIDKIAQMLLLGFQEKGYASEGIALPGFVAPPPVPGAPVVPPGGGGPFLRFD